MINMGRHSSKTRMAGTDRRKNRPTIGYMNSIITLDWALRPWLGIVDAARERDVNLVTSIGGMVGRHQANVIYDMTRDGRLDGLIIWNASLVEDLTEAEIKAFCEQYGIPVVVLEGGLAGFPCVTYENYTGLRRLTEHLIQVHGYQKIGFLGMVEHHEGFHERYRGYTDAMEAHGLPVDPTLARPWFPPEQLDGAGVEAHTLNDYIDHAMAQGIEAIINITDYIARQVLGELQKRTIRVPEQVAVVGFDDDYESRTIIPPLTTVKAPFYEMGHTAAETLVDLITGKPVPELVNVPSILMVRQSCGCQDPYVAAVVAKPDQSPATSQTDAPLVQPGIVSAMVEAAQASGIESIQPEVELLLEKFAAELAGEKTGVFLNTLGDALQQSAGTLDELTKWHSVLSALRQQILPRLTPNAPGIWQAEDLLQQAQVLVSRVAERTQMIRSFQAGEREIDLQRVSASLLTTLDINALLDTLADELPGLGIPSCYLSFFEDPRPYRYPDPAPEWARLVLAYGPQGRVPLESPGQRFPARQLIPDELWLQDRACSFVLLSLHFQEEQIGFVLFESGSRKGRMYETLRAQISSALQGALILEEHERGEKALRESEERYRTILENIQEGYFEVDVAGNFTLFSDALCEILGYPRDELMGMNNREYMDAENAKVVYRAFNEAYRTQRPIPAISYEIIRKDGVRRSVEVGASVITDPTGERIGFHGVMRDITERKQAEAERERLLASLEHRALQLQTAAEISRVSSSILDLNELLTQAVELIRNRFNLYYTGLFLIDETGQWLVLRAGTGEAGRKMVAAGHRLEVGGQSMVGWCVVNRKARIALEVGQDAVRFNNPFLPETRSELVLPLISQGKVVGVMTTQSDRPAAFTQEDITVMQTMADQLANAIENARLFAERKRAEERLASERNLLARQQYILDTFMENVPDRVYFKDLESRITRANKAHAIKLGLSDPAEEIGKSDFDFFPEEQARVKYEQEQEIIRTGEPVLDLEESDGLGHWALTTKMPLRDEKGEIIGTFGISRDITAVKEAQAALEKAYSDVERQVRERTEELRREQEESARLQQEVIDAQQRAIQELSTPIIPVLEGVIVMPLIGSLDSLRARDVTRNLLTGIREHRARVVILDITGVPVVDSGVAAYLNKTVQAARLKGARTIVTGISDAVAETIVDLGIDWSGIETLADLQTGLRAALGTPRALQTRLAHSA
jgi:PAS domain S-box-containing protein